MTPDKDLAFSSGGCSIGLNNADVQLVNVRELAREWLELAGEGATPAQQTLEEAAQELIALIGGKPIHPEPTSRENAMDCTSPLLAYSTGTDECNACAHVNGQCPFHAGVEAGIERARAALAEFAESA